jgi:hypothetical protein
LAFPILIVGLLAVRFLALRQVANGDRRFLWIYFTPFLAGSGAVVWAGVAVFGSAPLAGLAIVMVGVVTLALFVRSILAGQRSSAPSAGELSGPTFDYLIWMALGAPFILVGVLLLLALTGGLNH